LETPSALAIARGKSSTPALWWTRGLIDDLAQDLRPNAAFAARARLILQRPEPTSDISPPPFRDLVMVHADLLFDTPIPWAANCTFALSAPTLAECSGRDV
jgi:hypothetical protein